MPETVSASRPSNGAAGEPDCPLCRGIEFACFPIHLDHPSPFCSACGRSIPVRLVHAATFQGAAGA